jgi:hypothetical protein
VRFFTRPATNREIDQKLIKIVREVLYFLNWLAAARHLTLVDQIKGGRGAAAATVHTSRRGNSANLIIRIVGAFQFPQKSFFRDGFANLFSAPAFTIIASKTIINISELIKKPFTMANCVLTARI